MIGLCSLSLFLWAEARGDGTPEGGEPSPSDTPDGADTPEEAPSPAPEEPTESASSPGADSVDIAIAVEVPAGHDLVRNSVSCGSANRGALTEPATVPREGVGFITPEPWLTRGRRYGTDELVGLISRAAASVAEQHPGALLGVADLSAPKGGAIAGHRSHQSGRDADLIYYALDAQGQPFTPDQHMGYYGRSGRASYAKAPDFARNIPERYFDMARNWALVKALMNDTEAPVEHIFVSERVRNWLIRYAENAGESEDTVTRARRLLKRPESTGGHNDHMHIRVSCTSDDRALGRCQDHIARSKAGRRKFYSRVRCPAPPRALPKP